MSASIKYVLSVFVNDQQKAGITETLQPEAYDEIHVAVPAGESAQIQVQPGESGQVQFLFISAASYDPPLAYTIDPDGTAVQGALDAVLPFFGVNSTKLLGDSLKTFAFTNEGDEDNTVTILVGRDATA